MEFKNIVKEGQDRWITVRLGMPTAWIRDHDKAENNHFANRDLGGEGPQVSPNATESTHPGSGSNASKAYADDALMDALGWPLHPGLAYFVFGAWAFVLDPQFFPAFSIGEHMLMGYGAATLAAWIEESAKGPQNPPGQTSVDLYAKQQQNQQGTPLFNGVVGGMSLAQQGFAI